MKRCVFFSMLVFALLAAAARADHDDSDDRRNTNRFKWRNGGNIADLVANLKNRHDDDDDRRPIDPGRGDGKDPQDNTTPPSMPGFVWVGDHWERQRANQTYPAGPMIADPLPGTVVVRDHRKPVLGTDSSHAPGGVTVTSSPIIRDHRNDSSGAWSTGSVIVRDHRNDSNGAWSTGSAIIRDHRNDSSGAWSTGSVIVRDHRNSSAPGGITVVSTPRPKRGGSGGLFGAIGDAASGVVSGLGNAVGSAGKAVGSAGSAVGHTVLNTASGAARDAGRVVNSAGNAVGNILPTGGNSQPAATSDWTVVRDHRNR
jgi:hypothetical protein